VRSDLRHPSLSAAAPQDAYDVIVYLLITITTHRIKSMLQDAYDVVVGGEPTQAYAHSYMRSGTTGRGPPG
jgi:hypothetical protein